MNFLENMDLLQNEHIGRSESKITELLTDLHQIRIATGEKSAAARAELVNTNAKATEEMLKNFNQTRMNATQKRIEIATQDTQQRLTFASNLKRKVADLLDHFHTSRQHMAESSTAARAELVNANAKATEEMIKGFNQIRININKTRIEMAETSAAERAEFFAKNANVTEEMLKGFNQMRFNANQARIEMVSQDTQQRLTFVRNMKRKVEDLADKSQALHTQIAETSAVEPAEIVSSDTKTTEEVTSQDTPQRSTLASNEEKVVTPKIRAGLLKAEALIIASETTIDQQVKKSVAKKKQPAAKARTTETKMTVAAKARTTETKMTVAAKDKTPETKTTVAAKDKTPVAAKAKTTRAARAKVAAASRAKVAAAKNTEAKAKTAATKTTEAKTEAKVAATKTTEAKTEAKVAATKTEAKEQD
ncbi:hypothetical protein Ping_1254 [Psychromonas ingrahamii 37]|uniref:Uncharacterized protein n=1 Tax=Psychromonas ingrahamii (strain DSM 17664 / CCUG 51855 / 37) TaxID=357804 RepID=A1SUB8_PSYIN|nr:hypothetical protein [Psychromonas ingrahamii]ABM03083.1 hypothetical protein Ping_1254 [Psychromonas ingrahamii 37]